MRARSCHLQLRGPTYFHGIHVPLPCYQDAHVLKAWLIECKLGEVPTTGPHKPTPFVMQVHIPMAWSL